MQFHKINICQVMNFRLHTVYNKHETIKIVNQNRENSKYYHKCSNNFPADCTVGSKIIQSLEIIRVKKLILNAVL